MKNPIKNAGPWLLALGFLLPLITRAAVPEAMELNVDEQQTLSFEEAVRSAIPSDPTIIELQGIGERELVVRGKKRGVSVIEYALRNGERGRIEVTVGTGSELEAIQDWLNRQLRGVVGVETRVNESLGVVEMEGTVRLGEVYDRVGRIAERASEHWPRKVVNGVVFSPNESFAKEVILEFLKENDIRGPSVTLQDRSLRVSGTASSESDLERVSTGLPIVVEQLRLGEVTIENRINMDESVIEVELTFFQMSDSVVKEIGADLLNNIGLNIQGAAEFAEGQSPEYSASVNMDVGKVLNMLIEDGLVDSIHHTTLSTANGEEASTQFGESLVIVVRGADTDAVEEIEVGHLLGFTPTLKSGDEVNLRLSGEVSELGREDSRGNVRIIKNTFQNTVNMPLEAGLVTAFHKTDRVVEVKTGTPVLRDIPLVNLVFGKERSEKVTYYRGFLIVPRLQGVTLDQPPSVAAQTDEIIRRIQERTADIRRE